MDVLLRVLLLVFWNFSLVTGHVELRRSLATNDGESLLGGGLEASVVQAAILVLRFDVQHVLHVQKEAIIASGAYNTGALVHFKAATGWKSFETV